MQTDRERFFLLHLRNVAGIAGAFTFTSATPYVKGQGVRALPDRCSSHFPRRNGVIDPVTEATIEAIIEAIIDPVTEIPFTEFTRRFFIGVGVRALMRWRATNARWEYFFSWRKR